MDEFKEEVAKHLKALQAENPVPPKKEESNIFVVAAVMVLVFSITITGILFWKKHQQQFATTVTTVEVDGGYTPLEQGSSTPHVKQNPLLKVDLFPDNELSKRVDTLEMRQWLLGLALNENAVISKSIGQKIDPDMAGRYMILDEQWKLSKTPEFLRMTDEQRRQLIDHVRSQ